MRPGDHPLRALPDRPLDLVLETHRKARVVAEVSAAPQRVRQAAIVKMQALETKRRGHSPISDGGAQDWDVEDIADVHEADELRAAVGGERPTVDVAAVGGDHAHRVAVEAGEGRDLRCVWTYRDHF